MSEYIPNPQDSLERLRAHGEQFIGSRQVTNLDAYMEGFTIDKEALAAQGRVYVDDSSLRLELNRQGVTATGLRAARRCIAHYFEDERTIWGFSGYAMGGYTYEQEADGLQELYKYLRSKRERPSLAVDGGVSAGNLGLSGIVAGINRVPTLGFVPSKGLSDVGIRNHLVVWGKTYRERELLVGTTPDVLVCIGGGDGTRRECQQAIKMGSPVLLLALKNYGESSLPKTYMQLEGAETAVQEGRLELCESLGDLPQAIDTVLAVDTDVRKQARSERFGVLETALDRSF